jgi:hypothetical protein
VLLHSATAADNGFQLPEKENISPNQHFWPETAAQMGVKRGNKHTRKGKVDSVLTAQHISEPNCKCAADDDPYGAGEQSGKRAKSDALITLGRSVHVEMIPRVSWAIGQCATSPQHSDTLVLPRTKWKDPLPKLML